MTPVVSSSPAATSATGAYSPVSVGSIAGAGGAAVGVGALAIAGAAPIALGAVLAAPAFLVGYLVARRRRHDAAARSPRRSTRTPRRWRRSTSWSRRSAAGCPTAVQARVERVANTVRQTIPRLDQLGADSVQAHAVVRTATSYLPEAVAAYLRLPRRLRRPARRSRAARRRSPSSATSSTCSASKMDDLFDAACRADADALIAHGRFLAEKFSTGALAIDPQRR